MNDLAKPFDATLPAISQHIRVLESAGLVTRSKEAQFRPCALNTKPLEAIVHWTEQYRLIWEDRFETMDSIIKQMKDKPSE